MKNHGLPEPIFSTPGNNHHDLLKFICLYCTSFWLKILKPAKTITIFFLYEQCSVFYLIIEQFSIKNGNNKVNIII